MIKRKKLTMEDLLTGDFSQITMEDLIYNGFSGQYLDSEPTADQIKVACIGDSITYGHGIYNWPEQNYPQVLQTLLGDHYHVRNFGVCGRCVQDNTDQPYRMEERYRQSLAYGADIIVFMMGTNDSKPENWHGEAAFKQAAEELLDCYLTGEKNPEIYLCTPATAFFAEGFTGTVTKFDVQPGIVDILSGLIREIAQTRGYSLIDIHTLTDKNPQWFAADSVHPDNAGATAIAEAVFKAITYSAA